MARTFLEALALVVSPAESEAEAVLAALREQGITLDPRAAGYMVERVRRHGYDREAQNFGRLRCLLPHEHGSDGRCCSRESPAGPIWIRIYPDEETALRRLLTIARARTLSARPRPLCPECGKHDAEPGNVGSVIDDAKDKLDDIKSNVSTAWNICSLCRKIGATVGGAEAGEIVSDDLGLVDNVAGYVSRDPNRKQQHEEDEDETSGAEADLDKQFRKLSIAWRKVIEKLDASPADCGCRVTVEPLVAAWRAYERDWSNPADMAAQWRNLRTAQAAQGDALPPPDVLRDGDMILDVRTAGEFDEQHLTGAVNVPIEDLPGQIEYVRDLASGGRVVVFCAGGIRAARGVHVLREAGIDACSGHKDPTCGCERQEIDDPPGWRRETSPEGKVTIHRDDLGAVGYRFEIVPGIRADDLLTPAQRASGKTFAELLNAHAIAHSQIDRALRRGVLRKAFVNVAGADEDTISGKVTEIAAAWDGLRDRFRSQPKLANLMGAPYTAWKDQLAGYQRTGEIDLAAALDNLGSWIPDALNPWAPSDEAKARVAEMTKGWAEIEAKSATDPKLAAMVKPQHDHWIQWKAAWDAGNADLNDLRAVIVDYNAARANMLGIFTQQDKGRVVDIASEKTSTARGAAQTISDTADEAAAKAKAAADKAGSVLVQYKWPILAAVGTLAAIAIRR